MTEPILSGRAELLNQLSDAQRAQLQKSIAHLIGAIVIDRVASSALYRLTGRANAAGFAVPALTRTEATKLWRPAAVLAGVLACAARGVQAAARIAERGHGGET
jgi:hypothetical protein